MKKMIIFQPWGGLGDNLQFSTLPEMAKQKGYNVYISNKNAYRNNEICDLVWKHNPYIDGFTDEHPNAGSTDGSREDGISCQVDHARSVLGVASFVYCYEYLHGFNPVHKNPKIYYKPKFIKEVESYTLFDLGTITLKNDYNIEKLAKFIQTKYGSNNSFLLKHKNNIDINNTYRIESDKKIEFSNIFEFTDLIYSCKKFVCLWGGANALASAIYEHSNKTADVIVPNLRIYNQWQGFCFETNQYLILE
jgi:hypothetical protein